MREKERDGKRVRRKQGQKGESEEQTYREKRGSKRESQREEEKGKKVRERSRVGVGKDTSVKRGRDGKQRDGMTDRGTEKEEQI